MNKTTILHGNILTPDRLVENKNLVIENGKITRIEKPISSKTDGLIIDAKGLFVLPGFVDQHVHGGGGADTMDATNEAFETIVKAHARHGTTSLCLTTIASPASKLIYTLNSIKSFMGMQHQNNVGGAKVLGVNLEGPFLNPDKKGAHREEYIESPSLENFLRYSKILKDELKLVTIAPEVAGALELISYISKLKYPVVSIGHSNADVVIAMQAFNLGAKCITHFYNAMSPFHHRRPGIMGAITQNESVAIELIPDQNLIDPSSIKIASKLVGSERIIIITDALMSAGTSLTQFNFSGKSIQVKDGSCFTEDGTVWGSILTMDKAIRNFIKFTDCSVDFAVKSATKNPASLLGVKRKGGLKIGYDADVVVVNEEMEVLATIVEGNLAYSIL